MFQGLGEKFDRTFRNLRGFGKISEQNIEEAIREIRMNLLAADVNVRVVKSFLANVAQRAMGQEVISSLKPAQQFVKIVHDEMRDLLGGSGAQLSFAAAPPVVMMCVGLQGSGKTTTVAKLAKYCESKGRRPLLVPADLSRPAAVEQLSVLAAQNALTLFEEGHYSDPVAKAQAGLEYARLKGFDTLIVDTAGRLHVDDFLMEEMSAMKRALNPHQILFVMDAMVGQDGLTSAKAFHQKLEIDGVIMTKLDGDARGGSALSVQFELNRPIVCVGSGEKIQDFEVFYPDRMASRILGMGDVLTLVEEVQQEMGGDAEERARRLLAADFSLADFKEQLEAFKNMDKMEKWLHMIPGGQRLMGSATVDMEEAKGEMRRKVAIINSMTHDERLRPKILNGSRRKRIAKGSGTDVSEVNRLLKEFDQVKVMMKTMKKRGGLRNMLSRFGG